MYELPNYDNLQVICEQLNLSFSPAAIHGMLCGFLCAGQTLESERFLKELTNNQIDQDAVKSLSSLRQISLQQINTHDFEFYLLLPDDDEPLGVRAKALSEWCHGFVDSFNSIDINIDDLSEQESKDALLHIHEFSELDYQSLAIDEEDEKAYVEVSEYVRMAVLMLHTELTKNIISGNGTVH